MMKWKVAFQDDIAYASHSIYRADCKLVLVCDLEYQDPISINFRPITESWERSKADSFFYCVSNAGDIIVFHGSLAHRGLGYSDDNIRAFLRLPQFHQEMIRGAIFFALHWCHRQ